MKKIRSALISVYHKEGLDPIVGLMADLGVKLYSTGGTLDYLTKLGIEATAVEDLTGFPAILGGRVKTLHPAVFGGILARRNNLKDREELETYEIPEIDLVIVDLYPFRETVEAKASSEEIIEKIDIGGISLIRAAAKNFQDTLIVSSRDEYAELLGIFREQGCATSLDQRRRFAARAFMSTSDYDASIFEYFNRIENVPALRISINDCMPLRYGENPHQQGAFFGTLSEVMEKLHGKDISYNNLLDIEAAVYLIEEFEDSEPTFAILKHNNACGAAMRKYLHQAWEAALSADPVSAYGGVLICNRKLDEQTAEKVNELFFEVIIAPDYEPEALEILKGKKNRIIMRLIEKRPRQYRQFRSLLNGIAVQDRDFSVGGVDSEMRPVTNKRITEKQRRDLLFANTLVKHAKSNAIVLVKDNMLLSAGHGQTSRVDSLRHAIEKAKSFGFDLNGAVMASDAFFPFSDCVEIAHKEGIKCVIQPGGSVRDQDSIDFCKANDMAMFMTSMRHFRH